MNHADWTKVPTLAGTHARLEPLQMGHIDGLRGALGDGALSRLWYTRSQVRTTWSMAASPMAWTPTWSPARCASWKNSASASSSK